MNVVSVKFPGSNAPVEYNIGNIAVNIGDIVIVERKRGPALAEVVEEIREGDDQESKGLPKVLRAARPEDVTRGEKNKSQESEAFNKCRELITQLGLPMKLISVEYLFDGSKFIFYFTADGRVDFRDLVRRLAQVYRTRIEMLQIGVRDAAKMLNGIGICGRELCCATYLKNFAPVSVKMAKNQNLSLNPSKVSGLCSRLMCCLAYEHEIYKDFAKGLPKIGKRCRCPQGQGRVTRHDPIQEKVFVILDEQDMEAAFDPGDVERLIPPDQQASAKAPNVQMQSQTPPIEKKMSADQNPDGKAENIDQNPSAKEMSADQNPVEKIEKVDPPPSDKAPDSPEK
jgi:cell fate regulator YaaT (PSP1 superfamily)